MSNKKSADAEQGELNEKLFLAQGRNTMELGSVVLLRQGVNQLSLDYDDTEAVSTIELVNEFQAETPESMLEYATRNLDLEQGKYVLVKIVGHFTVEPVPPPPTPESLVKNVMLLPDKPARKKRGKKVHK